MRKPSDIHSLRDVRPRGAGYARLFTIPKQQRSAHLDLYVLARETERIEKELHQTQMRSHLLKKRLAQNNARMKDLLREIGGLHRGGKSGKHGRPGKATVKKTRIEY